MHDHVAVVEHEPAFLGLPLYTTLFLVILLCGFEHRLGKRVQHPVAGAVTDDKIIGKRCNVLNVEKQDVFALFVLQGIDDFMCKFECVQISPHKVHSSDFPGTATAGVVAFCLTIEVVTTFLMVRNTTVYKPSL